MFPTDLRTQRMLCYENINICWVVFRRGGLEKISLIHSLYNEPF